MAQPSATAGTPRNSRLVLVTGGAGFIGSHLVRLLLARGDRIVVVDDLSTGRRRNLAGLDSQTEPEGDPRLDLGLDLRRVEVREGKVSAVLPSLRAADFAEIYHLAAAVGVRLVVERPCHTIETNILETSSVLRFAAAGRTPLLIASTSEVYGKGVRTPFKEDDDVLYGPTTVNRWSYACSKAINEYLALAHHREDGLPTTIVRFFNTVGPRQVGEYGMVLPRFVAAALADAPIEVHGDGRQTRCFCDVRDSVQALPRLLAEPRCAGQVYNLGDDREIDILTLAETVRATLDSRSPIVLVPFSAAFGPGFEDLRRRQPDLAKIRAAIGWRASIGLEQTIRDIAAEMRSAGSAAGAPR